RHLPQLLNSPPHLLRRCRIRHQLNHRHLHLLALHTTPVHGPLFNPHSNSHPQNLCHQLFIIKLLRRHRPRHHRHPRRYPFHRRVPPAVRHESTHRFMFQNQHLRCPPPDYQALSFDPLLEPLRQPIGIFSNLVSLSHNPYKSLPGRF
ncbi:hypothetical protein LINGRAHAP2_LOCUS4433, partial [Linum grandiflorum]